MSFALVVNFQHGVAQLLIRCLASDLLNGFKVVKATLGLVVDPSGLAVRLVLMAVAAHALAIWQGDCFGAWVYLFAGMAGKVTHLGFSMRLLHRGGLVHYQWL